MISNNLELIPEHIVKLEKTMLMYDTIYGKAEPARQEFFLKAIKEILKIETEEKELQDKQNSVVQLSQEREITESKEYQIQNKEKTMTYSNEWIVIQNRLLHAISHLTLNERRLVLFLSPIIRQEISLNKDTKVFKVKAIEFASAYNIKTNNVYKILSDTADSILEKAFWYWNFKDNKPFGEKTYKSGVSWVSKCDYLEKEGVLQVKLDETVIEMLTVFDKANPFTKYQKEWITKLGVYGIILLELIVSCMYQKFKQKSYTIAYLREKFDCVSSYPKVTDFKIYVINSAIKEIHKHTPIKVTYEQKKQGRQVTEIVFSFEDTSQQTLPSNKSESNPVIAQDIYKDFKMTQKQLNFFGNKIATELGKDIEAVIRDLTNVYLQSQYIDMLKQLNYVPSKYFTDKEIAKQPTLQAIEQQQTENERRIRLADAERERQANLAEQQKKQEQEAENRAFIEYFESLPQDEQNRIINEVGKALDPFFKQYFDEAVADGIAHKDMMYRSTFKRFMEI